MSAILALALAVGGCREEAVSPMSPAVPTSHLVCNLIYPNDVSRT